MDSLSLQKEIFLKIKHIIHLSDQINRKIS